MTGKTMTLAEAFPLEQRRCRELLLEYRKIGDAGAFGAAAIEAALGRAERAAAGGDLVEMIMSYKELSEIE